MSSQKKMPPVKFSKLNTSKISFSPLEKNERSKAQKISYPRYTDEKLGQVNLVFQSPEIKISQYGIPTLGEYYKSDKDRSFIKLPLDSENKEVKQFIDKLMEIDQIAEAQKQQIIGKNYAKFDYVKIVREPPPANDDDDDTSSKNKNGKPKVEKLRFCKVKIDTNYDTGHVKTMVFKKLSEEQAVERKVKREEVKGIQTITDLATHIPYNSTVKLIVTANKLWATNAPDKGGRYSYGISLKLLQVEVFVPENKSSMIKNSFSTDAFIDEEDDDAVQVQVQVPTDVKVSAKVQVPSDVKTTTSTSTSAKASAPLKAVAGKTSTSDDDSEGDSDDDSSGEETVVPQKVQSKTKPVVKGKVASKVKT
jgi:hypothetical protein